MRTATTAGTTSPGNAAWIRSSVSIVGALFESASKPDCAVCKRRTGIAITISRPAASTAVIRGLRSAGVSTLLQKRFCPSLRRSLPRNGILPFSTLSPSLDSSAGSTVSEPIIATPTTTIVAIENDMNVLSPLRSIPPIAISTVDAGDEHGAA